MFEYIGIDGRRQIVRLKTIRFALVVDSGEVYAWSNRDNARYVIPAVHAEAFWEALKKDGEAR